MVGSGFFLVVGEGTDASKLDPVFCVFRDQENRREIMWAAEEQFARGSQFDADDLFASLRRASCWWVTTDRGSFTLDAPIGGTDVEFEYSAGIDIELVSRVESAWPALPSGARSSDPSVFGHRVAARRRSLFRVPPSRCGGTPCACRRRHRGPCDCVTPTVANVGTGVVVVRVQCQRSAPGARRRRVALASGASAVAHSCRGVLARSAGGGGFTRGLDDLGTRAHGHAGVVLRVGERPARLHRWAWRRGRHHRAAVPRWRTQSSRRRSPRKVVVHAGLLRLWRT